MTRLRKTLKRKYARQLFAGAVDHAVRCTYSVRSQPSVRNTILRLILATESMILHWMSAGLGVQKDLSWLLINREGYPEPPKLFGRWAGDRIEIIGDEEEAGRELQRRARKDYKDITVDAVVGFTAGTSGGRMFKGMGLIDKDGLAVLDPAGREAAAKYWRALWDQQEYELQTYLEKWDYIDDVLGSGSPAQVRALRCPRTGGPMRIQYIHNKEAPPHFRLSTPEGRLLTSPFAPGRPAWVDVLGEDFVTEPEKAEQSAPPHPGSG